MPGTESSWLLSSVLLLLLLSGLEPPAGHGIWFLETLPVMLALPLLYFSARTFPLTPLSYRLITLWCLVLIIGGHYSYSGNPLFGWLQEALDWQRNHYDRLGHFIQGFVPAILAREILLRRTPLEEGRWLFFLVSCVCLAIGASYELLEWWVAVLLQEQADVFLATQGDPWDTQWDLFMALCGAITAQLFLQRIHQHQLTRIHGHLRHR
jgi:putative membrane protein